MNSIVSTLGYIPKKIGVFKTASMADLPNDIFLFKSLKSSFPEATLVWISSKDSREIVKRFSGEVNEYMSCPSYAKLSSTNFSDSWFTEAMQQQKWDVIIQIDSYDPWVNHWIELWKPKLLIGCSYGGQSQSKDSVYLSPPESSPRDSIQSHVLKLLDINARKKVFEFPWTESDKRAITQIYPELFQHLFVCIHLGDAAGKAWPICYYTMIAYLLADHGYSVVFIANESQRANVQEICQNIKSSTFSLLRENLTWSNLAYLLNQSSLVIGDDRDIAQLAVHLSIPDVWLRTEGQPLQNNDSYPNVLHTLNESQPIKEVIHKIGRLLHLNQETY